MGEKADSGEKLIASNKKAFHDYSINSRPGIALEARH